MFYYLIPFLKVLKFNNLFLKQNKTKKIYIFSKDMYFYKLGNIKKITETVINHTLR